MTKTKIKYLIMAILFVITLIIFNTNTVNATNIESNDKKVFVENKAQEGLITNIKSNIINNTINIYLEIDFYKMYDVTKGNTDNITNDGYVYESIYIEIPNNIDSVTNKNTGKNLEITNVNGKKYLKYDEKLFKKQITCKEDMGNDEGMITLQYKEKNVIKEENKLQISYIPVNSIAAFMNIVDENGKYIGGRQNTYEGGPDGSTANISTAYDYNNAYYELSILANSGSAINIKGLGNFKYEKTKEDNGQKEYIYKMKIADTSIFTHAQKLSFFFEILNQNDNKKVYYQIDFNIEGETRKTYEVKDTNKNVGILLNGATEVGVSLKADVIDEKNGAYIEMTNNIKNKDNYITIGAYDIDLVGGKYEGELLITFDLGTENNGKKVHIWHQKANGTVEHFNEIVENGKVTVKVTELSPFLLAYETNKTQSTENNNKEIVAEGEKDETPKTGMINQNIGAIVLITILGIGAVAVIKKQK